jgi:hypothetical protein
MDGLIAIIGLIFALSFIVTGFLALETRPRERVDIALFILCEVTGLVSLIHFTSLIKS